MEIDKKETLVIFRHEEQGGVYALFPEDRFSYDLSCTAYQHVGQHCGADYTGCIARSRPAAPEEYADLKKELERVGYRLKIRKRWTAPARCFGLAKE